MHSTKYLVLFAALSACGVDYNPGAFKDDTPIPDDNDTGSIVDSDTDLPPDEEECNGEDDDGDGEIDEGYLDIDGDGIADCVDDRCETQQLAAQTLPTDPACSGDIPPITDPWNVALEWGWPASGATGMDVVSTPLVAHLTDTNGDGLRDTHDVPNIVLISFTYGELAGTLRVLEGTSGTEVCSVAGVAALGTPVIADVTGDGIPDIATTDDEGCLTLFDADGTTHWVTPSCGTDPYMMLTAADLYGDGTPELITLEGIYEGATGTKLETIGRDMRAVYSSPTVGDIDLDGEQEIILANRVWNPDGTLAWETLDHMGTYGHWSAIINADADPEAEIVMVGAGRMVVYEHDGTVIRDSDAGDIAASPICAADFDGDGATEVAWASKGAFHVYDLDGKEVWRRSISDISGLSGCSGYDVDGDGAYEIMYADEKTFYIYDGKTGTLRYFNQDHSSATLFEVPVIADVDADGSAEVLFVSNLRDVSGGATYALTVLGHDGDGWAKSGPSWPLFDFAVTNIQGDATLPTDIPLYWQDYNVYRARPIVDVPGVDFVVSIHDVCFAGCMLDSQVRVAVQVGNQGMSTAPAGISVSLYAVDGDTETLLETQITAEELPGGTALESLEFVLTKEAFGANGVRVRVDDDGSGGPDTLECDEHNNVDDWVDTPCP